MSFKVEKISGAGDDNYACGVFSKHITLPGGGSAVVASCVLVETGKLGGVENVSGFLHDDFESEAKKLAESQESVLNTLTSLSDSKVNRFGGMGTDASFVTALFCRGAVYIARHGKRVKVIVFRPPKSFEIEFDSGSGKVMGGDLVLLSTDKFIENFESSNFAKGVGEDFEDLVDGLATDTSVLSDRSEVGAVFVSVDRTQGEVHNKAEPAGEKTVESEPVVEEVESGSEISEAQLIVGRKGVLPFKFISAVWGEISKLRVGNIGALLRLRRNIVFLAVVIVLVLATSGYITVKKNMDDGKTTEFRSHYELANSKYSEALGVFDLNREKARNLLVDAQREVGLALGIFPDSREAKELEGQIRDKIGQSAELSNVEFSDFFDGSGSTYSISRGGSGFYVFGEDGVTLVDDLGKEIREISDERVDSGFVFDNNIFTLKGNEIFKLAADGESGRVAGGKSVRDMAVFLGNIYLLGLDQIMKFVPIEGGYLESADYLEVPVAFVDNSRFTIDGSVWVTNGNKILKYTRGSDDGFGIEGINSIGEFGEIYTDSDIDKVYVVDRTNSALIVVGKDGVYERTYNSREFDKATDLFVDEEGGKMYICVGSKVLVADL